MGQSSFSVPPDHAKDPDLFREFMLEIHNDIYGLGDDRTGSLETTNNIDPLVISTDPAVAANTSGVAANLASSSLNATNISTNTANILTNSSGVLTNTANILLNTAVAHTQGTDQSLDSGGVNQVLVADAKDAVTKKHTQNSDTFLDQGNANEVTAANAADAVTKKHDPGTNHNVIIQATAQTDVPAPTAVNPPAGGTGTAAGGYDTAANRDLMITSLTAAVADIAAMKVVVDGLLAKLRTSNSVAV